jgi:cell division protease FtsH
VPFFSITGSGFMEMLVGVGASRVRGLFKDARRSAPAIVFIDELDSIGRRRGAGLGGGHDEREQTLNQLLSEMDGFEPNQGVIVMAATNRPDILDPALLRPGRFDRRITVQLPGLEARVDILRIHTANKTLAADVSLDDLARGTPGFSGADLENLLNEAALLAARHGRDDIGGEEVEAARDKILLGLKREGLALTPEECRLLAIHESGHAVVAALLPHAEPVHKVSIVPRGASLGGTQQLPERDRYVVSRDYLLDRLAVMLGGRAAEELHLDTVTTGAEQDLREATQLARRMVSEWGMSPRFAHMALGGPRENVFLGEELASRHEHSETTAHEADGEIKRLLEEAHKRSRATLEENEAGFQRLVQALLEHEEVAGARVLDLLGVDGARA